MLKDYPLKQLVQPLLEWYPHHARVLPWREEPTPYRVWVSEIMLQQTRVEAVKPYFERFMRELSNIELLANCPQEQQEPECHKQSRQSHPLYNVRFLLALTALHNPQGVRRRILPSRYKPLFAYF